MNAKSLSLCLILTRIGAHYMYIIAEKKEKQKAGNTFE